MTRQEHKKQAHKKFNQNKTIKYSKNNNKIWREGQSIMSRKKILEILKQYSDAESNVDSEREYSQDESSKGEPSKEAESAKEESQLQQQQQKESSEHGEEHGRKEYEHALEYSVEKIEKKQLKPGSRFLEKLMQGAKQSAKESNLQESQQNGSFDKEKIEHEKITEAPQEISPESQEMPLKDLLTKAETLYFSKNYPEAINAYEQALKGIANPKETSEKGEKYSKEKYAKEKFDVIKRIAISYTLSKSPELAINKIESHENELKNSESQESKWMLREFQLIKGFALGKQKNTRSKAMDLFFSLIENKSYIDLDAMLENSCINSEHESYEAACKQTDELLNLIKNPAKSVLYTATLDSAERLSGYFMKEADYKRALEICNTVSILGSNTDEKLLELKIRVLERSGSESEIKTAVADFVQRFYTSEHAQYFAKKYRINP